MACRDVFWQIFSFPDIPKAEDRSKDIETQEASREKSGETKESQSETKEPEKSQEEQKKEDTVADKEREEAATRIQAAFRGLHVRKSMKETESSRKQTGTKSDSELTVEQLQEEFPADKGKCHVRTLEIVPWKAL